MLTNLGRKDWNKLERCPCAHREEHRERIHGNLGHSSAQQMEKLFREAMVSDEATEDLKHCLRDACSRLNQPHILEMKECSSRENKTWTTLNIVDAASGMHMESRAPNQTSHTLWETFTNGWHCWAGAPKFLMDPHRAQISKQFFDQAEGRGIFVDLVLADAQWHVGQVESHATYLRMMGNRTMEDLDIDEADVQQLPG